MSSYKKFNSMLSRHGTERVVGQIKEKFNGDPVPIEMFQRLDPKIRTQIPVSMYPPNLDPSFPINEPYMGPLNKRERNAVKNGLSKDPRLLERHARDERRKKERKKERERAKRANDIRASLLELVESLPAIFPSALLAKDRNPSHWQILPEDDADQLLAALQAKAQSWWEAHRKADTVLEAVLAAHHEAFAWPRRLPAAKALVELLTDPQTLDACPKQALTAATAYLREVRAQRAEEKKREDAAKAKRAAERARIRAARQAELEAQKAQEEREAREFMDTGRFPEHDPRSWRRLVEVAELVGLSPSTVRADLKKDRLTASGKTRGGYMITPTTLHSRDDIRTWLTTWRPKIDPALADHRTAKEIVAYAKLSGEDHQRALLESDRIIEGHRIAAPKGWPENIQLRIADGPRGTRHRIEQFPSATLQELDRELEMLPEFLEEAIQARVKRARWSPEVRKQVEGFIAQADHHYQLEWPAPPSRAISRAQVGRLVSDLLAQLVRTHPGFIPALSRIPGICLANPLTWYPKARTLQRRWVIHVGPTNSGKTHQAMQALVEASTGIYLAPLRLMALEGFDRLCAQGKAAALITGEERTTRPTPNLSGPQAPKSNASLPKASGKDEAPFMSPASLEVKDATHLSATIEAGFDPDRVVDVAIIDEAQMFADPERGWAWSQALAGVAARQLHVCTAPEALSRLKGLAKSLGEEVEVVEHERLTPLKGLGKTIGVSSLAKGDALVVFSRRQLLGYRSWLRARGKSVAVIYGDLGPEVRRAEAERFRSGKADILVATDAIGMGLNLPIRRVIFADTEKFDGRVRRPLKTSEWRQIAGRAGRFGIYEEGFYGRLSSAPPLSQQEVSSSPIPYFRPPHWLIKALAGWMGWTKLSEVARFWSRGGLGIEASHNWGEAGWLEFLSGSRLSLDEQYRYLGAPVDKRVLPELSDWVRDHARGQTIHLPPVPESVWLVSDREDLEDLEEVAAQVRLYRWCALAFPEVYPDDASQANAILSKSIASSLSSMELENLCNSCGVRLPVEHRFARCQPCFEESRWDRGHYY